MKKMILMLMAMVVFGNVLGGEGILYNAKIKKITHINRDAYGHSAGSIEIAVEIEGAWPSSVLVGNGHLNGLYYISTRKTVEGFNAMTALLTTAHSNGRTVDLYITDEGTHAGYTGRPNIQAVSVN